jgi:hypothetical protein
MTDLDTFAAAALTGLLADQSLGDLEDTTLATRAYELASAMIEERVKWSRHPTPNSLTHACVAALCVIENYQRDYYARTGDPFALDGMDSGCSAPISHVLKAAVGLPVEDWDFQVGPGV